jgi:tripartite-type tricarboxylate transporter receptor subunit TctC
MTLPRRKALLLLAIVSAAAPAPAQEVQLPVRASSGAQALNAADQAQMARAAALLKSNDVAAARLIYKRLAGANIAEAAYQLAQTYDQDFLKDIQIAGLQPDPAMAQRWYERAATLGSAAAASKVGRVPSERTPPSGGVKYAAAPEASGGAYPSHAIQLIIPASKDNSSDAAFRVLAQAMEPLLGQKIEIANKPANNGADGLAGLTSATPDGYTLAAVWNGPLTASPQVRKLAYTLDSFTPIASVFESAYAVCAHKDFPAKTGLELVGLLRQKPLGYTYGNDGRDGSGYFAAERLFDSLGVHVKSESFENSAQTAQKLAEKKVDLYVGTTPAIMPQIRSGDAKCLIIMSGRRPGILPNATTVAELGTPSSEASLWRLIVAPQGLPEERIDRLETAIRDAVASPAVQAFLASQGDRAFVHDRMETMARLKQETAAFAQLADRLLLKNE